MNGPIFKYLLKEISCQIPLSDSEIYDCIGNICQRLNIYYVGSPTKDDTEEDTQNIESEEDIEEPESPSDVKENIKCKFLVEMPDDFYQFWDFAKSISPADPKSTILLPTIILAGIHAPY